MYHKTVDITEVAIFLSLNKESFIQWKIFHKEKSIKLVWREAHCIALYFLFWAPEQGTVHHFSAEQKIPSLPKLWERWQLQNQSLGGQVACMSLNRKWTVHADFNV